MLLVSAFCQSSDSVLGQKKCEYIAEDLPVRLVLCVQWTCGLCKGALRSVPAPHVKLEVISRLPSSCSPPPRPSGLSLIVFL